MSLYIYQTEIRLVATFKVGGVNTDPSTVALRIKKPNDTVITKIYPTDPIVKDGVGIYHFDYLPPLIVDDPEAIGDYFWRWDGTGAVKASSEGSFRVVASHVI